MREPQQGAMVDCVYCKYIHPEFLGTADCPKCHGNTPHFQPARMMDRYTSQMDNLEFLLMMERSDDADKLKSALLSFLGKIDLYQFDLKDAIITMVKSLEEE